MHNRKSEIAKDFKGTIIKLIKYDKALIRLLFISLILAFASSALSIIGPDKLREITNIITNNFMVGIPMDQVKSIAIILIIIYALSAIFGYLEGFILI